MCEKLNNVDLPSSTGCKKLVLMLHEQDSSFINSLVQTNSSVATLELQSADSGSGLFGRVGR